MVMRRAVSALAVSALTVTIAAACSTKLEQKECDTIRGDAFDILNKAQHCSVDAECRQSEWPGCPKPLSNKTVEQLKPMADRYKKGQCEEPKVECKPAPEVYCK